MRALLLDQLGAPSTLQIGDIEIPKPGPGQIRIQVRACGLNPVDAGAAQRGHPDWQWPHVLGLDAAGVVDAVGPDVSSPTIGQRVAVHNDLRKQGGFAEFVIAEAIAVAVIPDTVGFEAAAALPCAGMTAYQAVIRRLKVREGQTVLVTAAAGGVGGFATQLAARLGARVIATASAGNAEHVTALGADDVVDYRTNDVVDRVLELTRGRGVDAVVDTVDAQSASANMRALTYAGGLAAVAGLPAPGAVPPFSTAPSVHEIALGAAYPHAYDEPRRDLSTILSALIADVEAGVLDPLLSRTVELDAVPEALTEIAARHVRGKLVAVLS